MGIAENIQRLQHELSPYHCTLIAVSKTHPAKAVQEAFEAGQLDFGENKVQEMQDKRPELSERIHWHLIGHLQTNKVKYIAPYVHLVHAVDSLKLAEEIDKQGQKHNRIIPCLLQVHIAQEETKFGADEHDIRTWLSEGKLDHLKFIQIKGLMGMASLTENQQKIKQEFRQLKKLFDECNLHHNKSNTDWKELSMGMSSDYKIALDEGSTMVRIGSAIFGNRTYTI